MSILPDYLKYTENHEWVFLQEDGTALIGLTDYGQEILGELTSVNLPDEGDDITQGDEVMSIEAQMASHEVFAPLTGEVVEVNEGLEQQVSLISNEPYDEGWLFKVQVYHPEEMDELLTDEDYQSLID